ncbi:MAG: ferritin-like domain-containing protein [Pigmentiphaga sp.]|uniref:ferritin-like domain-containing protein n=1 Tax=Pigmentiphaga sp. TaxID=1977564 RepID=UPI0029AB1F1B|nr:ferritin-like domain-containing protein [Pigmentiphaga sp.]MDX3906616.1 ferritin-like domain-containing protein [Pigmentiphaga sp.]
MDAVVTALPWRLEDIDFSRVDASRVKDDEPLFFLLCSASFVESGSDLYTRNLVDYYRDDQDVAGWLGLHWEPEELQHGRALRAYIEHVWPDFDWESAFNSFFDEYSQRCTLEEFEPTRALELAARCVVEMGTATLYRSLAEYAPDPVLRELTTHIRTDEVRHYKYFYLYFNRYNSLEGNGRMKVLAALVRRLLEIRNDDAVCAIRHVVNHRYPERANDQAYADRINAAARKLIQRNVSADMSVKMFLKPLNLPARMQSGIEVPLTRMLHFALR